MSIEFQKLLEQVQKMGSMIEAVDFDLNEKLDLARERFEAAGDLEKVYDYIDIVRRSDISGYRGAAPLEPPLGVPVNFVFPPPEEMPTEAAILAVDGSQIYPDEQSLVHYYLINLGMFVYHHGRSHLPMQISQPHLFFHKAYVHDEQKRVVSNRTVDARRTVLEMQMLAQTAWNLRRDGFNDQILALYDNHLLFWVNNDVTGSNQITRDYHAGLVQLQDAGAILAGYLDNPFRSRVIMRLLYLLSLKDEQDIKAHQSFLPNAGDLEGLRDVNLLNIILEPGERTAVMVQNSPHNFAYRKRGVSYEIAFFYVKVFNGIQSTVARVDIPMWVARDPKAVDQLHTMILSQCQMQGRTPYPYALIRADELAVVGSKDRQKLEELVRIELRRNGIEPTQLSAKNRSKVAARSDKRPYELRTDLQ